MAELGFLSDKLPDRELQSHVDHGGHHVTRKDRAASATSCARMIGSMRDKVFAILAAEPGLRAADITVRLRRDGDLAFNDLLRVVRLLRDMRHEGTVRWVSGERWENVW